MNDYHESITTSFTCKLLYLGAMECAKYRMVRTDALSARIRIPVTALLIHHPAIGYIVYDTGNCENWQEELFEDTRKNFPIVEYKSLQDALAEEGLSPQDIDLLIMSHLHFDHAGSIRIFAGTKAGSHVLVGRKEYERACRVVEEGSGTAYVAEHFLVDGIRYEFLDEDRVLGDGLKIFLQSSHSPAMLGLEICIPGERPLLCVSDSVYTQENYDTGQPPASPNAANAEGFTENLVMLKKRQDEIGADILFGHDMAQVEDILRRSGMCTEANLNPEQTP